MTAVVAHELLALLVIGEGDVAVGALGHGAAVQAVHERRVAPAVEQHHGLLAALHGFPQRLHGAVGKQFGGRLILDVHKLYGGQRAAARAVRQPGDGKKSFLCRMKGLDVRVGRAENQQRPMPARPLPCHFLGLIGQTVFLLEGAVVFLVEHDGAQRRQRQKQRRTRADDEAGFFARGEAAEGAFPLLLALVAVIEENGRAGKTLFGVSAQFEGDGHFRGRE